jgi:hypothetical protein
MGKGTLTLSRISSRMDQVLNIDKMDFRRETHRGISNDEWTFFNMPGSEHHKDWPWARRNYLKRLSIYHNRFQNHMPVEIRKDLLRKLEASKNKD